MHNNTNAMDRFLSAIVPKVGVQGAFSAADQAKMQTIIKILVKGKLIANEQQFWLQMETELEKTKEIILTMPLPSPIQVK